MDYGLEWWGELFHNLRYSQLGKKMIRYSKYYDWLFNRNNVNEEVDLIETHFYDKFTGELKTKGSPFKEIIQYDRSNIKLVRLEYKREKEIYLREHLIDWQNGKINSVEDISIESSYMTKFKYESSGLLVSEIKYRKKENELSFWDGSKYEYEKFKNIPLLKRIKKFVKISGNNELQEIFASEINYDEQGRIKEEILPLHSRDPQFDYSEKKVVMKFNYHTDIGITEVYKTYSNSEKVYDKHYFKEINGVKYYTRDFSVAQEIKFDNFGNLVKNGALKLSYQFDRNKNWIKKFDDGKLIEERNIIYK